MSAIQAGSAARIETNTDPAVIIVLGVPRSGTTLLRVLLGSHPEIRDSCETPWICGGYGANSLRHLTSHLNTDPFGPVANMSGVSPDDVVVAARAFVATILRNYARRSAKTHVLIKTPDDLGHLDFLVQLFPDASYVHLGRDGRDVACSTLAQRGKLLGTHMPSYGKISLQSALRRWRDWEQNVRRAIATGTIRKCVSSRYEDLVARPEQELRNICDFLAVGYTPTMLEYAGQSHDLPAWEAGSRDVQQRPTIMPDSVGKWKRAIPSSRFAEVNAIAGDALEAYGYRRCHDEDAEAAGKNAESILSRIMSCGAAIARRSARLVKRSPSPRFAAVENDFAHREGEIRRCHPS